ncbi:cobalt ECF transporter T component CbiQ [Pararhodospirillum oryzae]|uniref:Cobalt ECF transporter T component CbiQ n=1 Tax=Pararhodospirillum oryzae TaxID=478448 RepID=A0A512H755_9PROT|nr:cobalt ECF transporter T component CbiQ [Pararhodospirillum oryzae]GEO81258.1 hypothetical protein ROR02_13890 [Pararhodospirillum oryzae]
MITRFDLAAHTGRWARRGAGGKVGLAVGLLAVALAAPAPWGAGVALPAALALALGPAGVPGRVVGAVMAAPVGFLALSAPLLAVSVAWDQGLVLAWSEEGAWNAAFLAVRALAGTACLALLALTTPLPQVIGMLRRLGLPLVLADLVILTYRMVFLLGDSALTGMRAQQARLGYEGFRGSLRSLAWLASGLLVRTVERARRLEGGLAARGLDETASVPWASSPTRVSEWGLALGLPLVLAALAEGLALGGAGALAGWARAMVAWGGGFL